MDCYVVSIKHTKRRDAYITVWRPDDRGYAWSLGNAGRYPIDRIMSHLGYYNSGCSAVAVPCSVLDSLAVTPKPGMIDGDVGPVVLNTRAEWRKILASVVSPPAYESKPQFKGAMRDKGGGAAR